MSNQVYANNMEVSCKAASGKSICAFPDVCMTPPQTPATPPGVPIPYPNTGMASDTNGGTTSVKVSNQEVMLKNKSCFSKSTGDEAGAAPMKGVVTHKNMGKVYFTAWSMDVLVEGENVVRNLDLMTHNHGSVPGNTAPWMYLDETAISLNKSDACATTRKQIEDNCSSDDEFRAAGPGADCSSACCDAKKCAMAPYGSGMKCCGGKTKHHIIPDHCFKDPGRGKGQYYEGIEDLNYSKGLAICVDGTDKDDAHPSGQLKTHGKIHRDFDRQEDWARDHNNQQWTFDEANAVASDVVAFHTGCDAKCLKQQTEAFYADKNVHGKSTLRANSQARSSDPELDRSAMGNSRIIWSIRG